MKTLTDFRKTVELVWIRAWSNSVKGVLVLLLVFVVYCFR